MQLLNAALGTMYDRTDADTEVVLKHPVRIREIGLKRESLAIWAYCKIDVKHLFGSDMSVQLEFQATSPPFRWDEAGGIRIGQSRVTLDSLLASYHNGSTPEEIAVQYPVLHLAEIYTSVAYYLTHRQEIDSYLEQRRQKAQQQRNQFVGQHNLANLRQHLLDRYPSQGEQIASAFVD